MNVGELRAESRSLALREAADEVHIEARWQLEAEMRGVDPGGSSVDRLLMVERILRARAAAAMASVEA